MSSLTGDVPPLEYFVLVVGVFGPWILAFAGPTAKRPQNSEQNHLGGCAVIIVVLLAQGIGATIGANMTSESLWGIGLGMAVLGGIAAIVFGRLHWK